MGMKEEIKDTGMSEKKRSHIMALEQKLASTTSTASPVLFSSQSPYCSRRASNRIKKNVNKSMMPTSDSLAGGELCAATTFFQPSESHDEKTPYLELCQPVNENLLKPSSKHGRKDRCVTTKLILHDLFTRGDILKTYMRGGASAELSDRYVLLDNVSSKQDNVAKAHRRALHQAAKRSKKHISMHQHRILGSLGFPMKFRRYEFFLPMHEMWKEYIMACLNGCSHKGVKRCFLKADLHGAILAVVESKNKTYTGVQGIMVRETLNTYGILTSENRFHVVPKKGSIFMIRLGIWRVILHGDHCIFD